jgi:CRISPR/Cas system CSM-associated protein Csm5 (group 7 of RAMP superfamily)
MSKKGIFILLAVLAGSKLFGQDCSNDIFEQLKNDDQPAKVHVEQSTEIKSLIQKQKQSDCENRGIPGYRIRIFSDLSADAREKAIEAKARFYQVFGDDMPVYIVYVDPNFKVYVGDFKTRNDALVFLKRIKKDFPNAFPTYTQINYPEIK